MNINTNLNENAAAKLSQLQQITTQPVAEILQNAIDLYYQQFETRSKTPFEIFQENGLIGSIQAEPDLTQNGWITLHR